jgi:hypothetical protein
MLTVSMASSGLRPFPTDMGNLVIGEASDTARAIVTGQRDSNLIIVDADLCTEGIGSLASFRQCTGERTIVSGNGDQPRCLSPGQLMAADGAAIEYSQPRSY